MKKPIYLLVLTASLLMGACSISIVPNSSPQENSSSAQPEGSSSRTIESSTSTPSSSSSSQASTPSSLESSSAEVPPSFSISEPDLTPVTRNSKEEVTYKDLFDLNNKVSISIDIDREELEKIEEDNRIGKKPEMYRLAKKVTIDLKAPTYNFSWEIEDVGIRQKGNTSRDDIFLEDELNPRNHYKLSFDEPFTDIDIYGEDFVYLHGDASRADREFLGLSGLDFKWDKNDDQTHVKEIYCNDLYRSCGILSQHEGLATVTVNYGGRVADFGLCFIYEQTSKSFIKRSLSSNTRYINMPSWKNEKEGEYGVSAKKYGDYYKASYGRGNGSSSGADLTRDSISGLKVGVKTDIYGNDYPTYERKTNTGDDYSDTLLRNLVVKLDSNRTSLEDLDEIVDLDYFAIEEAVSYLVGNPDSFRNNYNNYMLYFRRTDGKVVFVPIDNDRALGIGKDWTGGLDFVRNSMRRPLYSSALSGDQRNPLFSKTLLAKEDNKVKEIYLSFIDQLKESVWVNPDTFESYFNLAKKTYAGEASFSLSGGNENISFEESIRRVVG